MFRKTGTVTKHFPAVAYRDYTSGPYSIDYMTVEVLLTAHHDSYYPFRPEALALWGKGKNKERIIESLKREYPGLKDPGLDEGQHIVECSFDYNPAVPNGTLCKPGHPIREAMLKNTPCIYTIEEVEAFAYAGVYGGGVQWLNPRNCQCMDCLRGRWAEWTGDDNTPCPPTVKLLVDRPIKEGERILAEMDLRVTNESGCETIHYVSEDLDNCFRDGPMIHWYECDFIRFDLKEVFPPFIAPDAERVEEERRRQMAYRAANKAN